MVVAAVVVAESLVVGSTVLPLPRVVAAVNMSRFY